MALATLCHFSLHAQISCDASPRVIVRTEAEPVAPGKFSANWESLEQYRVPEWFRDAKFGIWAHWGPQCQPGSGDWYAREMYVPGRRAYNSHLAQYGHPSQLGFKDVIHSWKAEAWDPERLMALYARAGAKYFFALANHHDNFDNWNSKYQPWNSVRLGPRRDLIADWAAAARHQKMRFGVSVHAAHAWSWYEVAQGADKSGPRAGVSYDGKLTAADGKGTWWEGLDPQDLYEQRHAPSPDFENASKIHSRWDWAGGVTQPDQAYCEKFYNRTMDLIRQHKPDLIYFDDTSLPLWPVSDAGLKIAAHFYNQNNALNGDDGVMFNKILDARQRRCMAWDIERGSSNQLEPLPWQTDTCLGAWHYDTTILQRHGYKSAQTVIQTLVDVVSKNGNLLLSVPLRGDGTPDADEIAILEGIASWMQTNQECIHGTRPWKTFGEGPQMKDAAPLSAQGFNEGKSKAFTAEDIRFTTKGSALYAIALGTPQTTLHISSLGSAAGLLTQAIASVELVGRPGPLSWRRQGPALIIDLPAELPRQPATAFRITLK